MADLLVTGPDTPHHRFVLAHGAGVAMDSPFLEAIANGLAEHGVQVLRFEFPYMHARRVDGSRKPPNTQRILLDSYREVIAQIGDAESLAIGGKSLGGRMASMIADELGVRALVCLGYPFHPPGRPDKLRTDHLAELRTPTLIVQGERDGFGTKEEVASYPLSKQIRFAWMPDGDHSFKPRKRSGYTLEDNLATAVTAVGEFLAGLS